MMIDFPNWIAGSVTIAALVGLGIFVYPWLLTLRHGVSAIGGITLILTFLFYVFDRSNSAPIAVSAGLAALWALAPVLAGVVVWRLSRPASTTAANSQ